jgi:hypothetical protein
VNQHPVAGVVVAAPFGHPGHHWQHRLGAVQGLHAALLVHTQHHGFLRRIVIQANDIDDLVHEQRIVGELETVDQVRFELKPAPDAPDRRSARMRGAP